MPALKRCAICDSPNRQAIEKARLEKNVSYRSLAKIYALDKMAFFRHFKDCVSEESYLDSRPLSLTDIKNWSEDEIRRANRWLKKNRKKLPAIVEKVVDVPKRIVDIAPKSPLPTIAEVSSAKESVVKSVKSIASASVKKGVWEPPKEASLYEKVFGSKKRERKRLLSLGSFDGDSDEDFIESYSIASGEYKKGNQNYIR